MSKASVPGEVDAEFSDRAMRRGPSWESRSEPWDDQEDCAELGQRERWRRSREDDARSMSRRRRYADPPERVFEDPEGLLDAAAAAMSRRRPLSVKKDPPSWAGDSFSTEQTRRRVPMVHRLARMRADVTAEGENHPLSKKRVETIAKPSDLATLKLEIARIPDDLNVLVPWTRTETLRQAVHSLSSRLTPLRTRHAQTFPLDTLIGALRGLLREIEPDGAIARRAQDFRTIDATLEKLNGIDDGFFRRIANQAIKVRSLLSTVRPHALSTIERMLITIVRKIDQQILDAPRGYLAEPETIEEVQDLLEALNRIPLFDEVEQELAILIVIMDEAARDASVARLVSDRTRDRSETIKAEIGAVREDAILTEDSLVSEDDFPVHEEPEVDEDPRVHADPQLSEAPQVHEEAEVREGPMVKKDPRAREDLPGSKNSPVREDSAVSEGPPSWLKLDAVESTLRLMSQSVAGLEAKLSTFVSREVARETEVAASSQREPTRHDAVNVDQSLDDVWLRNERSGSEMQDAEVLVDPQARQDIQALRQNQESAQRRTQNTFHAIQQALEIAASRLMRMERDVATGRKEPSPAAPRQTQKIETPQADSTADLSDLVLGSSPPGRDTPEPAPPKAQLRQPNGRSARPPATDPVANLKQSVLVASARRAARDIERRALKPAADQQIPPMIADTMIVRSVLATLVAFVWVHRKPVLMGIATVVTLLSMTGMITGQMGKPTSMHDAVFAPRPNSAPGRAQISRDVPVADAAREATPAPSGDRDPSSKRVATDVRHMDFDTMTASLAESPLDRVTLPPPNTSFGSTDLLEEAAESGNVEAQVEAASRYENGRQHAKDLARAAFWYESAARQGSTPAQYRVAFLYDKGLGVTRDRAKAKFWYTQAAEAGNANAMHSLGALLADGTKPDYAGAFISFQKAANYGVRDSQYNLGVMLTDGLGTKPSLIQAYKWFAIAAAQNDADSVKKRDDTAAKLSPDDLAIAKSGVAAFRPLKPDSGATTVGPAISALSPPASKSMRLKISTR